MNDNELRELAKIYGFETDQQRSERILKKMLEELERDIEDQEK